MRSAFLNHLRSVGKDIVLLYADVGGEQMEAFSKEFPGRAFNVGCREQLMVGMAAGLAEMGHAVYIHTITPFLIERAFEQIKVDIEMSGVNVKMVTYEAPYLGRTHVSYNAERLMGCFSNITKFYPANVAECAGALRMAHTIKGPCFINMR